MYIYAGKLSEYKLRGSVRIRPLQPINQSGKKKFTAWNLLSTRFRWSQGSVTQVGWVQRLNAKTTCNIINRGLSRCLLLVFLFVRRFWLRWDAWVRYRHETSYNLHVALLSIELFHKESWWIEWELLAINDDWLYEHLDIVLSCLLRAAPNRAYLYIRTLYSRYD